ncbi:helix-turn-helix transcriptional regulator [Pedobacter sp. L105]|uniref:ArsR/SmtB family transcription factor n=1 Tax=Pedobacter sp. L105 TaxID=1641871 RepID=UPI00131EC828|nr:hypothetical protein [Pedobacter sp. L105]
MSKEQEDFRNNQLRAVEILRILADTNSIAILDRILVINTCICGEFIGVLNLSKQELNDQLSRMISSGIIQGKINGSKTCYCLSPDVPDLLENILGKHTSHYTAHLYCNEC